MNTGEEGTYCLFHNSRIQNDLVSLNVEDGEEIRR